MQALPLPEAIIKNWIENKSYHFALDVCYVSNLPTDVPLNFDSKYLDKYLGDNSYFQMLHCPEEAPNPQLWTSMFFDQAFQIHGEHKYRTMRGTYLRIVSAYSDQNHASFISDYMVHAVNLIRLKYGFGAALERADSITHDFKMNTISKTTTPILIHSTGDGRTDDSFYQNSKLSGFLESGDTILKEETSILLYQAFEVQNFYHRFLLLWMALECQIGLGKARKRFCINELKSDKINRIMLELHKIRSASIHSLREVTQSELTGTTNTMLELLRISALQPGAIRDQLVQQLEKAFPSI